MKQWATYLQTVYLSDLMVPFYLGQTHSQELKHD